ncbi:hypothetical protein WN944_024045 [Citrus x changshan-huyou]|uniref:DUF4216 domain-containing protein n=1 Tax=Citrus x changshan-huyou TaxID=2935761 RepID=A0AAP0LM88_9ROSI
MSYTDARDKNPHLGKVTFHGMLKDIIEIHYNNDMKFVLFTRDLVDDRFRKILDEFNFTMVNFNHLLYKNNQVWHEPFILAGQVEQVCYVQDPVDLDWHVVMSLILQW